MKILINEDIEDKDFRENVGMHFTLKQFISIVIALLTGGVIYAICYFSGADTTVTDLFMMIFCAPILLIGFFEKQGFGFLDYARKCILLRLCRSFYWQSTEDTEPVSLLRVRYINERREGHDHTAAGKKA